MRNVARDLLFFFPPRTTKIYVKMEDRGSFCFPVRLLNSNQEEAQHHRKPGRRRGWGERRSTLNNGPRDSGVPGADRRGAVL